MAKIIIIDDNGSTIEMNFDSILDAPKSDVGHKFLMNALKDIPVGTERSEILSSIKQDMVVEFLLDKVYCCSCGMLVLMDTVITDGDKISCQLCDESKGTERYRYLTRKHGHKKVLEYFARWVADNCMDDDPVEELIYHYTQGISADPKIQDADAKNLLNSLDKEDWFRVKTELEGD